MITRWHCCIECQLEGPDTPPQVTRSVTLPHRPTICGRWQCMQLETGLLMRSCRLSRRHPSLHRPPGEAAWLPTDTCCAAGGAVCVIISSTVG